MTWMVWHFKDVEALHVDGWADIVCTVLGV